MNKILVIAGSNASDSINQDLAKKIALNENVDYIDTRTLNIPLHNRDLEINFPSSVIDFYHKIKEYQNLIIVTPEYNGNLSSFFKSILDWLSRHDRFYLDNINVIILSASPGQTGGASVRESLKNMLSFTNANIIGTIGFKEYDITKDYSKEIKKIINLFNH
ncbi:MAG: NAD(P)H-dependent oxidoreductase [Bacilli bacterium]|jgi:chromate reductase|nr:NAD(P)H-dependent oxidoreductase [Bacilli bacterium]